MMETVTLRSPRLLESKWLCNYLRFLSMQGRHVHCFEDAWCIEGEQDAYTFAIPGPGSSIKALIARYPSFLLLPDRLKYEPELKEMGFHPTAAFHFMYMPAGAGLLPERNQAKVVRVADEQTMEMFHEVQTTGFRDDATWHRQWHSPDNDLNKRELTGNPQAFYLALMGDEPAGVSQAVFDNKGAGIYGVTTLPAFRRQGVGTAMVSCIRREVQEKHLEYLTMQTVHGSYAEFYFQRLGFKSGFLAKKMSRVAYNYSCYACSNEIQRYPGNRDSEADAACH
jgi:ribosomal protein S18 acetylase RimI-like enzyme